jgi:methylglutaconyl-CoA hydratase
MSTPLLIRSDLGRAVTLTLNRPEARNALSRGLLAALSDALTAVSAESAPRAVILTGAGTVFCAGMDLKEAAERGTRADPEAQKTTVADLQAFADVLQQLHTLDKPTIAALNGDALAGGAGLATACDFVLAAAGARVGYPEVKRGLVAAVVIHDLVRLIGAGRARWLLLRGQPIGVEEAERWGLVSRVVPAASLNAEAHKLAGELAECGPRAIATIKHLLDEATSRPPDLRGAAAIGAAEWVSDEAIEGIQSFLQKRPPKWAESATECDGL